MDLYILEDNTHTLLRCQTTKLQMKGNGSQTKKDPHILPRQSRYVSRKVNK